MWSRTLLALLLAFLLNVSLMLNLAYLVPMPRDIYLLIGFVGGFLLWAGFATYYYSVDALKKPVIKGLSLLAVSAGVNAVFALGIG